MGAISYLPSKNPFDNKKKLLILTELALAIFLFLLPGGPGRPISENGPDPDELANFHRNGWPVDISLPELFDYYVADHVAGAPDRGLGSGDETNLTVVEEEPSQNDSTADDVKEEDPSDRSNHNRNQDHEDENESGDQSGQEEDPAPSIDQADVNVAPEAAENQTVSTEENISVLVQLLATDSDGDSLSFDIIANPLNGTLSLFNATSGNATYTPNAGFVGSDWFDFIVTDGEKSDTARVFIQVIGGDSTTVIGDGNYTATEDEPLLIDLGLGANGTDPTIDIVVSPQNGTVIVDSNSTIVYVPDPDYTGSDSFVVNITDSSGSTVTQNVTVNIVPVNDPPVALNLAVTTSEDTPIILTLVNGASDVDGDVTSLIITSPPSYGTISISPDNATITYSPNQDFHGTDTFSYTITDSTYSSSGTVEITVTPVNDTPTLISGSNLELSTSQGSPVQINVLSYVTDADGDSLTISNLTQPTNGIAGVNSDGTVTYAPSPSFVGQDSFTFTVTDPSGASTTVTLTITVSPQSDAPSTADLPHTSSPPVANDISAVLDEDTSAIIQLDGTVAGQGSVTHSIASGPSHGTVTVIDSAAGTVLYTPFPNYFGSDSFTYMVSDGTDSVTATVELVVNGIDDIPAANDISLHVDEGTPVNIEVHPGLLDVDGDLVSIEIIDGPEHGSTIVNGDGTLTYVPDPDFAGTDSFVYSLSDENGGSSSATVLIMLSPVNDIPLGSSGSVVVDEDGSVEIPLSATDPDTTILEFEITEMPQHGSLQVTPGGSVVIYTPDPNYHGTDSFSYHVTDGLAFSDTATVNIVVNSIADAPEAQSYSFSIVEDATLIGDVMPNDVDPDGDALSASLVQGSNIHGTVVIAADGSFTFTPEQDFSGIASFQYQISDGNGGIATATTTITVSEVNDAPVAFNDLAHTERGNDVLIDVLTNDPDADSIMITVDSVGSPSHGSAEITSDGQGVTYRPADGFTGEDTFSYVVTDGEYSASANVTVVVYSHDEEDEDGDSEDREDDERDHDERDDGERDHDERDDGERDHDERDDDERDHDERDDDDGCDDDRRR